MFYLTGMVERAKDRYRGSQKNLGVFVTLWFFNLIYQDE